MKISLGIYPNQSPGEIVETGKLADDLGFARLWILDSHLLFWEVYTLLGALAVSTRRIGLGTAVTNPLTRHPTVTASAFATLAALSGGRATLGISVGDSALKAMNLEIAKVATLAETVEQCRALLAGADVAFGSGKIAKLQNAAGFPVPIYVAATGPRMLRLAGEIADGVILMNGVAPPLIQAAIDIVRQGEKAAGRKEGATRIVVWAACHPDYDAVKFNVARAILRKPPGPDDALTRTVAAEVSKAYSYAQHGNAEAAFAHLIPDDLVPRFAFSGGAAAITMQIDALRRLGTDEVALAIPFAPGIASREEVMRTLGPALLQSKPTRG
jgi:5,10-methylenetetrahydromethanopterin reductase